MTAEESDDGILDSIIVLINEYNNIIEIQRTNKCDNKTIKPILGFNKLKPYAIPAIQS